MKKFKKLFGLLAILLVILASSASIFAQQKQEEKKTKFGIGFQASIPAFGISGMMDLKDKVAIQAVLGPFGDLKTYTGKGIYRFKKEPTWNVYGYGTLGIWRCTGYDVNSWDLNKTTETVLGLGAGAGIEYDWLILWKAVFPKLSETSLPPLFFNLELGLSSIKFKKIEEDFSDIIFGAGVHYRF